MQCRSIRLEHLLLDQQNNLFLTGFTRAIFALNPYNFQINKCSREFACRKRNHLPPEAFVGSKHSPVQIDEWSFCVIIASLSTNRHPFNPKLITLIDFEQQWQEFVTKHGTKMNSNVVAVLNTLFVTQENERIHLNDLLKIEFLTLPDKTKTKKKSPKRVPVKTSKPDKSTQTPSTAVPNLEPKGVSKSRKAALSHKSIGKSTKTVKSVAPVEKSVKRENVQSK